MRCSRLNFAGSILAIIALAPFGYLHAEVDGPHDDAPGYVLVMGIIEDADPVGSLWTSYTDWEAHVLNPNGLARVDGPPHFGFDLDGSTSVVWSYNTGLDHDVAFTQWHHEQWLLTEFLSSGLEDDLDPRIDFDSDGNAYVVYWNPGPPETVSMVFRAVDSETWRLPEVIVNVGRRPSVATIYGMVLVAYERDTGGGAQELVVQSRPGVGPPSEIVVATTQSSAPMYALLHSSHNQVWMEWIHGDNLFGYSVYENGVWVAPDTIPWEDPTWFGIEHVRRVIQSHVLSAVP